MNKAREGFAPEAVPAGDAGRARARRRFSAGKIALVAGGILVLVVACAVHLFEWNMLRGPISRHMSEVTGRPFAINGDLSVSLALQPRIVVRDLVIGNAPWSGDPNMIEVGAADFTVDAPGLLRRRIVIPHVTLSDARIVLEKNAAGEANWIFHEQGPDWPWGPPQVGGLTIDRGRIEYRDPATKTSVAVDVATKDDATADATSRVAVAAKGHYRSMPLKVDGEVGNVLELRTPENPYPIRLRGVVGATR